MRKQYHFRPSPRGLYAWDVGRLIQLTQSFETKQIPILDIQELNEDFWFSHGYSPTCKAVADHAKLIQAADLSYPIILCPNGRVMDGMHRVCKAYMNGHEYITAKQFSKMPEPDYQNISPDELDYT